MKKYSLLWQLKGGGLKGTCYIFGTMHAHDSRVVALGEGVKKYVAQCDSFASEIDQDATHNPMDSHFFIPNQRTLAQVLPTATYRKLQTYFPKYTGNKLELFERWQPMLIQNILTESAFLNDSPETVDANLWQYAKSNEKRMLGLETLEEQQVLLQRLSLEWQVKMLSKSLKNLRSSRVKARKIIATYLSQDLPKLHKSAKKTGGKARKWLLYERNKVMAKRLMEFAENKTIFAAVGAGHLMGSKGILYLLQKKGVKVKAVLV